MFIAISGISGSGKSTVMANLIKRRDNLYLLTQASATTRKIREEDNKYQTYVHMTEDEFKKGVEDDIFIEHENVHGYSYGTLKKAFERVMDHKENDYIKDIDVKGTVNLKKYLQSKVKMVSIFLDAPDEVLRERLLSRGESSERIDIRLSRGEFERSYKDRYDLVIENTDLAKTLDIICEFLDKTRAQN